MRALRSSDCRASIVSGILALALSACGGGGAAPAPAPPPLAGATDFGPNVLVFDDAMPRDAIQAQLDRVFASQESNQFGAQRHALLFKPGSYAVNARVGFYTHVAGLGHAPSDVRITGNVQADARWFNGNATHNFWRQVENLAVVPASGTVRWAVSQAAPFRRVHVQGNMVLDDNGWSSGGFIADSVIDGGVNAGHQQQWLTRSSRVGGWAGGDWNMVFVGTRGAPAGTTWPSPPVTNVATAPVVREKPFLVFDQAGYGVFVPALRRDTEGPTWQAGAAPGATIPISQFHVARADRDTAASINAALDAGKHLLLTPGIYALSEPLRVSRADTVVLGIGLATLAPQGGFAALRVADVDGVKVAGLLIDAGAESSPVLMEVGTPGSHVDHAANPSSLHDLFFRVGGAAVGRAQTSLQIHSDDVIGDHLWLWRGDHSHGVGWTVNTTENGLVVHGEDVTLYGLFVEHYHRHQTVWNGNGGRVYFYQSEAPYEVPSQAAWMDGAKNGFASYKVAEGVATHEAWGLGVYCFFSANPGVRLHSAIEAPDAPGVRLHRMTTLSLGGTGEITHVLNERGSTARAGSVSARLAN